MSILSITAILLCALAALLPVNCHQNATLRERDHLDHHTRQAKWDGIYQGDLRLGSNVVYNNRTRRLNADIKHWDNFVSNGYFRVFVVIDDGYSAAETSIIEQALKLLQYTGKTIKFQVKTSIPVGKDYIRIKKDGGCWSYLGRHESASDLEGQTVSIDSMCLNTRAIHHLMLHALGFGHEQSRTDRDKYVTINYDNIPEEHHKDFAKMDGIPTYGIPYDFKSVMHYEEYAFAANWNKKTIVSKTNQQIDTSLNRCSWFDFMKLRLRYQCIDPQTQASIPRTFQDYKAVKCKHICQCWKRSAHCNNDNENCKGNLVCKKNVCVSPY
jgi:hypothetical protein